MLDGPADVDKELQSLAVRQLLRVTELGDWQAMDQLHDKVRSSVFRRSRVEHFGHVGMVHQRQGLPLRLKPRDHIPGIHAGLDDLQSDLARDGCLLLGHINDAEAPLRRSCSRSLYGPIRVPGHSATLTSTVWSRPRMAFHEAAGAAADLQQMLHPLPQARITRAGLVQKRGRGRPGRQILKLR